MRDGDVNRPGPVTLQLLRTEYAGHPNSKIRIGLELRRQGHGIRRLLADHAVGLQHVGVYAGGDDGAGRVGNAAAAVPSAAVRRFRDGIGQNPPLTDSMVARVIPRSTNAAPTDSSGVSSSYPQI